MVRNAFIFLSVLIILLGLYRFGNGGNVLTAFYAPEIARQNKVLFRIVQNDRVGYIDDKGKIVIKPIFLNGEDFSEGLAAVRQNGFYGFINEEGVFIIPPQYDLATSFTNGLAVVYKNGIN